MQTPVSLLLMTPRQFVTDNVFFQEPSKNIILMDGTFSRILYSTSEYTMNGIFMASYIHGKVEPYFNKHKYIFNQDEPASNATKRIAQIERDILALMVTSKIPQFKLKDQLRLGYVKFFSENTRSDPILSLKISGVWETATHYGLTYKFQVH